MSAEKPYELGLYISRERDCINQVKVKVRIVRKSDDGEHVCGLVSATYDGHRLGKRHARRRYEDLVMAGQVYVAGDNGPKEWIAYEPRYETLHYIELRDAKAVYKTLSEFERAKGLWYREHGLITPVNMFAILARFVGAKFVVYQDNTVRRHGGYSSWEWRFLSLASGIHQYQCEIARVLNEHVSEKERVA